MSEPIKIVGEWRTMERLTPGAWLVRFKGSCNPLGFIVVEQDCMANFDREYLGPLEIVDPVPEPTPLPGCNTCVQEAFSNIYTCASSDNGQLHVFVCGATHRQAVLRHNAAVKAIVELEKLT